MAPLPAAPWANCFKDPDQPSQPASIQLQQVTRKTFILGSSLEYIGETGVPTLPADACVLRPEDLGDPALTDLASVPSALRWFVSSYDVHTPAALLHDRLIGPTNDLGVSEIDADRFFRYMLKALGVRFVRRWMMWTAVAFGTRWRSKHLRPMLILWLLAAVTGMSTFVYGLFVHNWWLVIVAALAPLPTSLVGTPVWCRADCGRDRHLGASPHHPGHHRILDLLGRRERRLSTTRGPRHQGRRASRLQTFLTPLMQASGAARTAHRRR